MPALPRRSFIRGDCITLDLLSGRCVLVLTPGGASPAPTSPPQLRRRAEIGRGVLGPYKRFTTEGAEVTEADSE